MEQLMKQLNIITNEKTAKELATMYATEYNVIKSEIIKLPTGDYKLFIQFEK
jgi:hypothetical protein